MENYIIQSTEKTPNVIGDPKIGNLTIRGRSYPDDERSFFTTLELLLDSYYQSTAEKLDLNLQIEYMNTASSSFFFGIMKNLKLISASKPVSIKWFYEADDTDMKEIGEDFQSILGDIVQLEIFQKNAS